MMATTTITAIEVADVWADHIGGMTRTVTVARLRGLSESARAGGTFGVISRIEFLIKHLGDNSNVETCAWIDVVYGWVSGPFPPSDTLPHRRTT